jgi:2-oxoglutarate ferredoxin oxidoreductase subunit alpha
MAEYAGLAYFAEVPLVVWNIQRVGPSTGLPTRTAQGDVTFTHYLGHGDTQQIVLLPGSVNECFEFGWRALDIAEVLQAPVFVLSDLDLGMNQWMTEPFEYPNEPMQRGKVLWEGDLERISEDWGRYLDIDGDGIPYRTLPGNRHPKAPYFARGTGHDAYAQYSEDSQEWVALLDRLKRKFDKAREIVPAPVLHEIEGAEIGIIAYGSTDPAIQEAQSILAEKGLKADYQRIRAIPFTQQVEDFIRKYSRVYVVEMNRDGQLHQLLSLDYPELVPNLISIAYMDGLSLTAQYVADAILAKEEK